MDENLLPRPARPGLWRLCLDWLRGQGASVDELDSHMRKDMGLPASLQSDIQRARFLKGTHHSQIW